MEIIINKKIKISRNSKPLIIAEISANHCGSKKKFLKHILAAKKCGADLVKIQTYQPDDMLVNKNFVIKKGLWKNNNLWHLYQKAHTPYEWHFDAFKLAKKNDIELFSTPFSIKSLNFLKKFKPKLYKISSFELTDYNLVNEIAKLKKPIILSTGLANIKEIKNALKIIKKWHNKVILMYCVSSYPTKLEEIKFEKIDILRKKTGISNIGFSDHTKGISAAIASISNGVRIVEKHFKLNGKNKSPDQIFSIDENDTKKLRVEFDKLDKIYSKTLNLESKNSLFFRRSIYAISNIKRNEKFTKKNIACYRPFTGLCASNFLNILGKKSKKTIKINSVLKSKDF
jgi:pseudaminic acid synthase